MGVKQTVVMDEAREPPYGFQALGGVAVIADNTWAASQGRKETQDRMGIRAACDFRNGNLQSRAASKPPISRNMSSQLGRCRCRLRLNAAKLVEANYYTPLLAHAPMEPPAAVADFRDGKVEIWAATQNPQAVLTTVARLSASSPKTLSVTSRC